MRALAAVVAIHVVGLGAFFMVQGCATNNSQSGWEDLNTMPKEVSPPPAPHMPPVVQHRAPAKKASPYVAPVRFPTATGTYKVSKGDTLSGIAAQYGLSWKTLAAMNGIDDPRKLRVGQSLSVPAKSEKTTSSSSSKSTPAKTTLSGGTYQVRSGDTLSGIASRNKVKVADLKAANGLSGDRIIVGQKLVVPGVSAPAQPKMSAPTPASSSPVAPAPAAPVAPAPAAPLAPVAAAPVPVDEPAPASLRVKAIIVYSGDTLDSIAAQYYTTVKKLNEMNKFTGPVQLRPGQRIYVPISE